MQKRHWCFTINNPGDEDEFDLDNIEESCNYLVYQMERGENGTPHIQGYVQMKKSKRLNEMKRLLKRAHLEFARGTPNENKAYCTKEDTRMPETEPYEFGTMMLERQRTDLQAVGEALVAGGSIRDIAMANPQHYMRYNRGMHALALMFQPLRSEKTKSVVFFGESGTGKSMAAHKFESPYMVYEYSKSVQFYDGYDSQSYKTIVYDEFYGDMPWRSFLQVTDWTPLRVHIKGGQVPYNPEWNVFTSNKHPSDWYPNMMLKDVNRIAMKRRLDCVVEFMSRGVIRVHKGNIRDLPAPVYDFLKTYKVYNAHDLLMHVPTGELAGQVPQMTPPAIDPDYAWFCEINGVTPQ